MARVRFWNEAKTHYIVVRVEEKDLETFEGRHTLRKARIMPPKKISPTVLRHTSSHEYAAPWPVEELLTKLVAVLDDLQETALADPMAMITLGRPKLGQGFQLGVKFQGQWSNFSGSNLLEAMMLYYDQVVETEPPPPPLRRGDGK